MKQQLLRSPCVALCKLDDQEVCQGCYRTISEIVNWSSSSDSDKQKIIARIAALQSEQLATKAMD